MDDSTAKRQPKDDSIVQDYHDNIATRLDLEQMHVSRLGRRKYQTLYLWGGIKPGDTNNKATNTPYQSNIGSDDLPTVADGDLLPTIEEQTPLDGTKLYLEVGVIIADDLGQCSGRMNVRVDTSAVARSTVMEKSQYVLRVVTPINDFVSHAARYYVACRRYQGHCVPRTIKAQFVFFYSEFVDNAWSGDDVKSRSSKAIRKRKINAFVLNEASIIKTPKAACRSISYFARPRY